MLPVARLWSKFYWLSSILYSHLAHRCIQIELDSSKNTSLVQWLPHQFVVISSATLVRGLQMYMHSTCGRRYTHSYQLIKPLSQSRLRHSWVCGVRTISCDSFPRLLVFAIHRSHHQSSVKKLPVCWYKPTSFSSFQQLLPIIQARFMPISRKMDYSVTTSLHSQTVITYCHGYGTDQSIGDELFQSHRPASRDERQQPWNQHQPTSQIRQS